MFRYIIIVPVLYFASTLVPLLSNNLTTATPICKISYSATGGRSGNYENLEICPDSLYYLQAHRGVEKTIREKTGNTFWNDLTAKVKLKDFKRIKSNPGHALYDGIDITIAIANAKEKHSVVNGNEDTLNYQKIRPFTDLLENKLEELRTKITW